MRLRFCVLGFVAIVGWMSAARAHEGDSADAPPHPTLPECQLGDPELLLPDLVPDNPTDVRNIYQSGRRVIVFTTAVGNIGDGPLVIEGRTIDTPDGMVTQGYQIIWRRDGSTCARATGRFEFHPAHQHFHFDAFVGYELRSDDPMTGPLAATGLKASFCLLDVQSIRGFHPDNYPRQIETLTCDQQEGIQGISVGWKDVYERFLAGQSIVLDIDADQQVPVGSYFLVNRVDPDGLLWEKRTDNNVSFVSASVSLPPPNPAALKTPEATPRPRHPHLNPGRARPTRAPHVRLPTSTPRPTRTARVRPTRPPRIRPRPIRGGSTPTPTPTATPVAVQPTATATPAMQAGSACENACLYSVSQIRMVWYRGTGLSFSALIGRRNCAQLRPDDGTQGAIEMSNFLTEARRDTGLHHEATFTLTNDGAGESSDDGIVQFSPVVSNYRFSYATADDPPADASLRAEFPVVFEMCVTLGNEAVKMRLVCQAKSRGMLCHQG